MVKSSVENAEYEAELLKLEACVLKDNRILVYHVFGVPLASNPKHVVIYIHGNISCYIEGGALHDAAEEANISLIAFDRPGIGKSTFHPNMTISSVVDDITQLADHLKLPTFHIMGNSAGAPYAGAAAALIVPNHRVLSCTLCGPVAPCDRAHPQLYKDLPSGFDKFLFSWCRRRVTFGMAGIVHFFIRKLAMNDMDRLLKEVGKEAGNVLKDEQTKRGFILTMLHAYEVTHKGLAKDMRVLATDWKVEGDFNTVRCPCVVWMGEGDVLIPRSHGEWWEMTMKGGGGNEKGCEFKLVPDADHYDVTIKGAKEMMQWIVESSSSE